MPIKRANKFDSTYIELKKKACNVNHIDFNVPETLREMTISSTKNMKNSKKLSKVLKITHKNVDK